MTAPTRTRARVSEQAIGLAALARLHERDINTLRETLGEGAAPAAVSALARIDRRFEHILSALDAERIARRAGADLSSAIIATAAKEG